MSTDLEIFHQAATQAQQNAGFSITCTGVHRFSPGLCAGRFRLNNGLTIVLAPDFRAPVFAYQSWFKVGSKHENPERTGLAHLFEHLMFKGTRTYKSGVFDREMELRGSQTNAATWVDWTYYHEALAARADNLARVIDFESDRMHNLVLDTETFRSELEVVKNERRLAVEDSVAGALNEKLFSLAFTKHPYRWPTIGSMAHLQATTLSDLENFYRTYYAPNNAVVVICGAVELAPTLELVARAYGPLKEQVIPPYQPTVEPAQEKAKQASFSRPLVAAQMIVAFRAPSHQDANYAALELVSEALVSGDSARLYQRLVVEEDLCLDIDGALMPFSEPGLYEFFMTVRPGADCEQALAVLQDELAKITAGLSSAEFEKAQNNLELAFLDSFRDAETFAEVLGHYEATFGDFSLAFKNRWAHVQADDLKLAAQDVFSEHKRCVVIAYPQEAGSPS